MAWPREGEPENGPASIAADKVIFDGRFEGASVKSATRDFPFSFAGGLPPPATLHSGAEVLRHGGKHLHLTLRG